MVTLFQRPCSLLRAFQIAKGSIMRLLESLRHMLLRFRYPVSMPEDIATALGIPLPNALSFTDFVIRLCQPSCLPTRLARFMPRELAEKAFCNAIRTERFYEKTLVSYYFPEGWLEFVLQFDKDSRLRRVYLLHREIQAEHGVEILLGTGKK